MYRLSQEHSNETPSLMEIISCTEYERIACAVSSALKILKSLKNDPDPELSGIISISETVLAAERVLSSLREKILTFLESLFLTLSKGENHTSGDLNLHTRSFLHCTRALTYLQLENLAEERFVASVIEPFIR
jgi:hypothetical protein